MNVAIIDADLIGKKKHRFPNLACMKISGYQKEQGNKVILKLDYDNLTDYDQVFISKVFTDTPIDSQILQLNNVIYGGTGFYYDQAKPLPYEIEHHMPDYHLYDEWVDEQLANGGKRLDYKYYLDYSIGYTCYDDQTEVLTDQGWKLFKDLNRNEYIMTLNPDNNEIEWQKPYEYIDESYNGDMYYFKNKYIDLLVTPNHNMYVNKNKKYELIRADVIKNYYQYRFKKNGIWHGDEKDYFYFSSVPKRTSDVIFDKHPMDLFVEFLGYYLSEGSTQYKAKTNSYIVRIAQNADGCHNKLKGDTFYKIEECIRRLGYKYYLNKTDGISISNKQLYQYCKQFGKQPDRFVPEFIKNLSSRQIRIFVEAYVLGDGMIHKSKNARTIGIVSSSSKIMDDFQELFLKIGGCGDIHVHTEKGDRKKFQDREIVCKHESYYMYLNNYYSRPYFIKGNTKVQEIKYNGRIYCVEVKNHIIYVRRNGIVSWCGNTRGCFRHCEFCVNKNYKKVELHSPLNEFLDAKRKKICLLDDNVFGYSKWKDIFLELQSTGKPFQYKQGLDERLLTDEKCKVLFSSRYDGDYIFAFDNIADYDLIERKLKLIREYTDAIPKFYVFCGFDRDDKWDYEFWIQDIFDMMKRIRLLQQYHCLPYIMRFNRYIESPYQGVYKVVAAWCNQPSFFKMKSLLEFASLGKTESVSRLRHINKFLQDQPAFEEYINMKWS